MLLSLLFSLLEDVPRSIHATAYVRASEKGSVLLCTMLYNAEILHFNLCADTQNLLVKWFVQDLGDKKMYKNCVEISSQLSASITFVFMTTNIAVPLVLPL